MLKMFIDNEEVVSKKDFTIKEEMQNASSTILNNTYPKTWEQDKDYTSRFYYPKDYAKLNIQNHTLVQQAEAGTTIQVNGNATLNDVDASKNSRVTKLLGQTSQTGTPTPSSPIPVNVVSGDNDIKVMGKNLLDKNNIIPNNTYTTVTQIPNGVKITNANYGYAGKIIIENLTANTDYYLSYTWKNISSGINRVGVFAGTTGTTTIKMEIDGNGFTFNTGNNTTINIWFYANTGTAGEVEYTNIMLETGNQATNYEPYISSSYPIDLPVDNLMDLSQFTTQTQDGITFTKNSDGSITINGTATSNITLRTPITPIALQGGTTYTLSKGITYLGANYSMSLRKQDQTFIDNTSMDSSVSSVSFTPSSGVQAYYFQIYIVSGKTFNNHIVYPMVEIGNKENHFVKYGTTPIELCKIGNYQDSIYKGVGSNLLDNTTPSLVGSTITWTPTSSGGTFTNSGTWGDGVQWRYTLDTTKQYTLKMNTPSSSNLWVYIRTYTDDTYSTLKTSVLADARGDINKTFIPDSQYVMIRLANSAAVSNIEVVNMMLNEGGSLPYEPYNAKDKWLLHKEIGKIIYDGTEAWSSNTSGSNKIFYKEVSGKSGATGTNVRVYTNYFNYNSGLNWQQLSNYEITMQSNSAFIFIRYDEAEILGNFKTWLSTHNLVVYYILATPTTTQITDTTLISQLDSLESS